MSRNLGIIIGNKRLVLISSNAAPTCISNRYQFWLYVILHFRSIEQRKVGDTANCM